MGIGVTSAVFQAKGKVSNSKVALIIDVNDGKIAGKTIFDHMDRNFISPRGFAIHHRCDYFLYLFALHCVEGELL